MTRAFREAIFLALLAIVPAVGAGFFHRDLFRSPADELSVARAVAMRPPVLWIDARSADDFAGSHIPDAILLNEDNWEELLPGVLQAWKPGQSAVVYCSSVRCNSSREVARRLREIAPERVYVLKGGWESWRAR